MSNYPHCLIVCLECQNAVEYDEPDYKPNYCDNCGVKYNE